MADRPNLIDVAQAFAGVPTPGATGPVTVARPLVVLETDPQPGDIPVRLPDGSYVNGKPASSAAGATRAEPVVSDWNANPWNGTSDSDGVKTEETHRAQLPILGAGLGVRLLYQNTAANPVRFKAAVEHPQTGELVLGRASDGTNEVLVAAGRTGSLEFPGVPVTHDDLLWVRTRVKVDTAGQRWRMTGFPLTGDGYADGDLTAGGAIAAVANVQAVMKPSAVVVTQPAYTPRNVITLGDSITAERWTHTVFRDRMAMVNVAQSGERVHALFTQPTDRLSEILRLARYVTNATEGYGINDLLDDKTFEEITDLRVRLWLALQAAGVRVFALTTTPNSNASGSFGWSPAREAERVKINDWLRAGAPLLGGMRVPAGTAGATTATVVGPDVNGARTVRSHGTGSHPLAEVWDYADVVETARNSGAWKAGYSADGIHPTVSAGTAPLVPLVDFASFQGDASKRPPLAGYDGFSVPPATALPAELHGRRRGNGLWTVQSAAPPGLLGIIAGGKVQRLTFSAARGRPQIPRVVPKSLRVEAAVTRNGTGATHASSFAGPYQRRTVDVNGNEYSLRAYAAKVDLVRTTANGATSTVIGTFARVLAAAGTLEVLTLDVLADGTVIGYVDGTERFRVADANAVAGSLFGFLSSEGAATPNANTGVLVDSLRWQEL